MRLSYSYFVQIEVHNRNFSALAMCVGTGASRSIEVGIAATSFGEEPGVGCEAAAFTEKHTVNGAVVVARQWQQEG